jgi:hypothetical protein
MRKRSNIDSPGDLGKFTKSLARLVTGNPIAEDYSPIAKEKDPAKNPSKPKLKIAQKPPKHRGQN